MNIFIAILAAIVAIVALLLIIALFLKKEYQIERDVVISKPVPEVFDYVKLLKNHDQYNKWLTADPNLKRDFSGVDGTAGCIAAWESTNNQVGKGEQEIKKIIQNERIDCEIRFERPFEGISQTQMITTAAGENETNVKWIFDGKNKYPMNAMFFFLSLDKMLGKDMAISLVKLKSNLEK